MTIIELTIGSAVIGIIAIVMAGIFKAGVGSSNYSLRQGLVVANAQKAVFGERLRRGVSRALQDGVGVNALNADSLDFRTWDSPDVDYYIENGNLIRSHSGLAKPQAVGVTGLEVRYYNLDSNGLIIESTAAVSAQLVTARIAMQGKGSTKSYAFFTGATMRNHP